MDEFEQFLKKQPLRTVPTEWKAEILTSVERATGRGRNAAPTNRMLWWREWLWPSPAAWAALGCVWLIIIALNVAAGPTAKERELARRAPRSPDAIAVALAQQQRELAGLLAQPSEPMMEPRRAGPPGPRSEIRVVTVEA